MFGHISEALLGTDPTWFIVGIPLLREAIRLAISKLDSMPSSDPNLAIPPNLAIWHFNSAMEASIRSNERGQHSVAIALLRQCLEALSVVELGLIPENVGAPLLQRWTRGRLEAGKLRAELERQVWPRYGEGLWTESWAEFYAELARALQPYSHYGRELMGWQFVTIRQLGNKQAVMKIGPPTHDTEKATRIAVLHILLGYVLGQILSHNHSDIRLSDELSRLRAELVACEHFVGRSWAAQLAPHTFHRQ